MLIAALVGAGLCKGIYDANIFASLFDVVRPEDRGTAAGLMNTVGWSGAMVAPPLIGKASEHFGLGVAITATAAVYLLVGLLALSRGSTRGLAAVRREPNLFSKSRGASHREFLGGQQDRDARRLRLGSTGRHQRFLRADARQHRRHDPDGEPAGRGFPDLPRRSCSPG